MICLKFSSIESEEFIYNQNYLIISKILKKGEKMQVDAKTKKMMMDHIKSHNEYPATKVDLVAACNNMSEFSQDHKKWFEKALPTKTYNNANEVIKALGL